MNQRISLGKAKRDSMQRLGILTGCWRFKEYVIFMEPTAGTRKLMRDQSGTMFLDTLSGDVWRVNDSPPASRPMEHKYRQEG